MNATGDSEEGPELLAPDAQGMPLSAPVAASMLQTRELGIFFRAPDEPPPARPPVPASPATPVPPPAARPPDAPALAAHADPGAGAGQHDPPPDRLDRGGSGPADVAPPDLTEDPQRVWMREQLDEVRARAANASSWLETSVSYARLLNRDGVVPVTARFTRDDIEFLGQAREQVLGFAELWLRLLELHAPLDAGGISTDPSNPILRCRSCMWRWPCPTFGMLTDALSQLPHSGAPPGR
jgi:hypothetical protein